MRLLLHVDGSVRSGSRGGIGCVLALPDGQLLRRIGKPLDTPQSCNTAEYEALLFGLREALRLGATEVECYTDSTIVYGHLVLGWQCNAPRLQELREQARALLSRFSRWTLTRIESEQNTLAHTYACVASTQNRKRFFWQHPRKAVHIHERNTSHKEVTPMRLVVTKPELLEPDVYPVRLTAVEAVRGNFGEQLKWRFTVTDRGATLTAWSNLSTALNSKTLRWASVLAGERFTAGDVVDFDQLVGREARAVVDVHTAADGRQYNRISDLLPAKPARKTEDEDPFLED